MVKRLFAWAALAYVIVVSAVIFRWNSVGHFLPLDPIKDDGKWRGEAGQFADFCFLFGTLIYPSAIFAIVILGKYIFVGRSAFQRMIALAVSGSAIYAMYWNSSLGVGSGFGL